MNLLFDNTESALKEFAELPVNAHGTNFQAPPVAIPTWTTEDAPLPFSKVEAVQYI